MAVTLEDLRAWGRIDAGDANEHDAQMALRSAIAYFDAAGVPESVHGEDEDYKMGVCMLASYRYDNREAAQPTAPAAIPFGVRDIILQLRYAPRSKEV